MADANKDAIDQIIITIVNADAANTFFIDNMETLPPTVTNDGGASNITSSAATLNGNLTSTGGAPTQVYVYWGLTNGGTTNSNWANTNSFGTSAVGLLTTNVSSLLSSTNYYYRFFATNGSGGAWAPSTTNFTTPTPGVFGPYTPQGAQGSNWTFDSISLAYSASYSDNLRCNYSGAGQDWLYVTNFGFNISTQAIIEGIVVEREGYGDNNPGSKREYQISLTKDGYYPEGTNRTAQALPLSADNTDTIGTALDLWETSWLAAEINLSSFGVMIADNDTGSDPIHFDRIRVTVYFDRLPRVNNNGGASDIGTVLATLNGTVTSTGQSPTYAWAYWGTNDGGTAISGWNTNSYFGVVDAGSLATNLTGLSSNTLYYYRFCASNSAGTNWADATTNFWTWGPPAVNNDGGASNVTGSGATLNGNVTRGSPTPNATIYYGSTNGGTNASSWANSANIGGTLGFFSQSVAAGLVANRTNYYRCYATNVMGEAWAASTTNFLVPGPLLSVNNAMVDKVSSGTTNATFTITLSLPSAVDVFVSYATSNGTAQAGTNYVAKSGSLTIPAGALSTNISVTVNADTNSDGLCKNFYVNLSGPTNATFADARGEGSILDYRTPRVLFSGSKGGIINASAYHIVIPDTITVDDTGYLVVYAKSITVINHAEITAYGKGFGGGGGGGGTGKKTVGGQGFGGLPGSGTVGGVPGSAGSAGIGGSGGDGGGTAGQESWMPDNGGSGSGAQLGGNGGKGGGPFGGAGGLGGTAGAVGGDGKLGGYNVTDVATNGYNDETTIGDFFVPLPTAYGDYNIKRGSGSGGGGGGGLAGQNGKVGGDGGAVGGVDGTQASGGGGGGAAGGGAVVLRAVSGPLDMGCAGTLNTGGAAGQDQGGSGAGGGICLAGPSVVLGVDTVVTNLGGTLATNGGTLKIWYHSAGTLSTNNAKYYCGKLFVDTYGPRVDNDGGASSVTATNATLNGTVVATGGAPATVSIYWGTTDGGAAQGGWASYTNLGVLSTGLLSTSIYGLPANQTYYYRVYATNSQYYHWAGSSSNFTTLPPTIQFTATNSSGTESISPVGIQLTLSATSAVDVTVNYTVVGGTASNGADYALANGTATIKAGSLTTNISIIVTNDTLDEFDETIGLAISGPASATLGANTNHTYTILDDDDPPVVSFSGAPYAVDESATNRTVTVILSAPSAKTVSAAYGTSDGTATNGLDYTNTTGTLTWNAGDTAAKTFVVPIIDDVVVQPDHMVNLTLSNEVNCTIGASNTTIIIIDNDGLAKASFLGEPFTVDEGYTNAVISVTINKAASGTVTVDYVMWDGTATANTDYTNVSGTLMWTNNETGVKTFTVPIVNDAMDEPDEIINVGLTNAQGNTTISGNTNTTLTISDNDLPPTVSFTGAPYSIAESGTNVTVTVTLSAVSGKDLAVNYATSDGSAAAGLDYTNVTGTLTWTNGQTGSQTFTVPVLEDALDEYDETMYVTLSGPSNTTLSGSNPATITIQDNDPTPTVSFSTNAPYTVDEGCTNAVVTLILSAQAGRPVSVDCLTSEGTATNGLDFSNEVGTVTWNTYVTNAQTFLVPIIDNLLGQTSRTVNVVLTNPVNCSISGSSNTTITINDNDAIVVGNYRGAWQITATNAILRGQVIEAHGQPPSVRFYWGPTDGLDNPFDWAHSIDMGVQGESGETNFSGDATGLVENVTYYYRVHATRGAGDVWAPNSESFVALDPPSVSLLVNGGMEQGSGASAANWTPVVGAPERINSFPRTGSYSMKFPIAAGIYVAGSASNDFRISWNGLLAGGGTHGRGGVRPGFVLNGKAYTRSGAVGKTAVQFTYRWFNVTDALAWMTTTLAHTNTAYQLLSISKSDPAPAADVNDACRPELWRVQGDTGNPIEFYGDDLDISASLPRLSLSEDPTDVLEFPDTKVGLSNVKNVGARSQGGGSGTILYGAYITNAVDLTNNSWSQTAWVEFSDPSNAFNIVTGATLAAANGAGYQYCTLRFAPPDEGSFTGVVRIATTDPSNHYANGGTIQSSIAYNEYTLVGRGIKPPTVSNDGGATNIAGISATLRGQVISTGGSDPFVRVYWGRTNGVTNAASWTYTNDFGVVGVGVCSNDVAGLKPNRPYYYRVYGENLAGGSWADSTTNFTTPPVPPILDNDGGASGIGMTEATLNGNLISCGGTTATVRIYWGVTNGGTNASSWSNTVSIGLFEEADEGLFNSTITGLALGTTYWYRCYATNVIGGTWASPSTNFTTLVDTDGDGMPDAWETAYGLNPASSTDGTNDTDGDGVVNRREYTAGTVPTNAASYLRFLSMDVTNVNDILFSVFAGSDRSLLINSAAAAASNKTVLATQRTVLSGTNWWSDTNAVSQTPHRYYSIGVSYDGASYTNTEEWAMHVQNRPATERFLLCAPVDLGSTNANNLGAALGQQLGRGLYAAGTTNQADKLRYMDANGAWQECFWMTNAQGIHYWRDRTTGTTADVPVTAGMGLWILRGTNSASRSNTVFAGRSFTEQTVTNLLFFTNRWTLFGWPLARPRVHQNLGVATPTNQLGFEPAAKGGKTSDPLRPADLGDQLWVWKDNTWKNFYWLIGQRGAGWDGRWWNDHTRNFADFSLEPGQGYYYSHTTNGGATNFSWKPANAP